MAAARRPANRVRDAMCKLGIENVIGKGVHNMDAVDSSRLVLFYDNQHNNMETGI